MHKLILILTGIGLLTACATSPLEEKAQQLAANVNVIDASAASSCKTTQSCKYLGEVYCIAVEKNGEKTCRKDLTSQVVKHGGDTLLLQQSGTVKGFEVMHEYPYYRGFGQAYDCAGKHRDFYQQYSAQGNHPAAVTNIRFVDKSFNSHCPVSSRCKIDKRKWSCGSSRSFDGFELCYKKFITDLQSSQSAVNYVVMKDDKVNGAGFYRLYVDSYACR